MNNLKITHVLSYISLLTLLNGCGVQVLERNKSNTQEKPNIAGKSYFVKGQISGLPYRKGSVLSLNGIQLSVESNGNFTFSNKIQDGTAFDVDVVSGPGGAYVCNTQNDAGIIKHKDVTDVFINCECSIPNPLVSESGTEADPIKIYTAAQLNEIAINFPEPSDHYHYKQVCDVDYTGIQPKPIGDSVHHFSGAYDGNGFFVLHYHSDASVASVDGFKGLFGKVKEASLKNISFSDVQITATSDMAGGIGRIGALVALAPGAQVENVYGENITINDNSKFVGAIGGLIGHMPRLCADGTECNGTLFPTIKKIHVENINIIAGASQNVGGVVGKTRAASSMIEADKVNIQACNMYCGGVFGFTNQVANYFDIIAINTFVKGNSRVGGVVGGMCSQFGRVAFIGTVDVTASTLAQINAAGIAGYAVGGDFPIKNSFTSSTILSPVSATNVGRMYGNRGTITNGSYDSSQSCTNCSIVEPLSLVAYGDSSTFADVTNPVFIDTTTAPFSGTNPEVGSWDFNSANPVWCKIAEEFPRLTQVPYSVCQ